MIYDNLKFKGIINEDYLNRKYETDQEVVTYIDLVEDEFITFSEKKSRVRELNIDLINCDDEKESEDIKKKLRDVERLRVENDDYMGSISSITKQRVISATHSSFIVKSMGEDKMAIDMLLTETVNKSMISEINRVSEIIKPKKIKENDLTKSVLSDLFKKNFINNDFYIMYVKPSVLCRDDIITNHLKNYLFSIDLLDERVNADIFVCKKNNYIVSLLDLVSMQGFDYGQLRYGVKMLSGIINENEALFYNIVR